ncbi:unnamed protein product [Prunus brigantina]
MSDLSTSHNRVNPYNCFHPHHGQSTLMSKELPPTNNQETMIHETAKQTAIGL